MQKNYLCICTKVYRHEHFLKGTEEILVAISRKERGFLLFTIHPQVANSRPKDHIPPTDVVYLAHTMF